MSRANAEAFQRTVEALNRGDTEATLHWIAEDVEFIAARSAVEGVYHGHDGIRQFSEDNEQNFELFRVDLQEVRDLGDRVLAIGTIHVRGRGGGIETDVPIAGVATFSDGKMTRWEDFRERRRALDAVGLRS